MSRFDVGFTDRVILLADRRPGHALGAVEGPLRLELAAWLIRSQTVIAIAAISIAVRRPRMNAIAVAHPASANRHTQGSRAASRHSAHRRKSFIALRPLRGLFDKVSQARFLSRSLQFHRSRKFAAAVGCWQG